MYRTLYKIYRQGITDPFVLKAMPTGHGYGQAECVKFFIKRGWTFLEIFLAYMSLGIIPMVVHYVLDDVRFGWDCMYQAEGVTINFFSKQGLNQRKNLAEKALDAYLK